MSQYRCDSCRAVFKHPQDEDCGVIEGACELMTLAGWKPVWARLFLEEKHILTRGGWICGTCVTRYDPVKP